mmetsp:Transcript_2111/g.6615  ORF Transcript_2111/g.6615 Transcript_2111/m.6615 type:complete len:219 (-) Transcript_2111:563-1219(-)
MRDARSSRSLDASSLASARTSTVAFTLALTFTDIACWPNERDASVSAASAVDGATHTTSAVRAPPESAGESSRVSLHSRKGGRPPLPFGAARMATHLPRHSSEELMAQASSSAAPVTAERRTRSEPARSTRRSRARSVRGPSRVLACTTRIVWDRDDEAFIAVAPITRFLLAASMRLRASSMQVTRSEAAPVRTTPSPGISRSSTLLPGLSRSEIESR